MARKEIICQTREVKNHVNTMRRPFDRGRVKDIAFYQFNAPMKFLKAVPIATRA